MKDDHRILERSRPTAGSFENTGLVLPNRREQPSYAMAKPVEKTLESRFLRHGYKRAFKHSDTGCLAEKGEILCEE